MLSFLEWLKNSLIFIAILGLIYRIVIFFKGDKKTRIERNQKMNEFRNISFDFLVRVFSDYTMINDYTPLTKGGGIYNLIEKYKQECVKYKPFMTCVEKIRYRKYTRIACNHKKYWQNLITVKRRNKNIDLVLSSQKNLIKKICWLGKKTSREQEANKLKNEYEQQKYKI